MKAFLVILVIAIGVYLWMHRTPALAPAPRPPTSERAVSALDPKVPIDRAKAVVDKVQAQRKESGEYSDRR